MRRCGWGVSYRVTGEEAMLKRVDGVKRVEGKQAIFGHVATVTN